MITMVVCLVIILGAIVVDIYNKRLAQTQIDQLSDDWFGQESAKHDDSPKKD